MTERDKDLARAAVLRAVTSGKLIRPEYCTECYEPCKPQAHHDDYNKPLDVVWLCVPCHADRHFIMRRYPDVLAVFKMAVEISKQIVNKSPLLPLPRFRNARCNSDYINRGAGQGSGLRKHKLTPYAIFTGRRQGSREEATICTQ